MILIVSLLYMIFLYLLVIHNCLVPKYLRYYFHRVMSKRKTFSNYNVLFIYENLLTGAHRLPLQIKQWDPLSIC